MKLRIKNISNEFILEPGEIQSLCIENPTIFRMTIEKLIEEDEDYFILTKDFKKLSLKDNAMHIINPFDLNLNSKANLSSLQNDVVKEIALNGATELEKISNSLIELIDGCSLQIDAPVQYDLSIDTLKILKAINFQYDNSAASFLEKIINFIKISIENENKKIVFSMNLLSMLSNEEIKILREEIKLNNTCLFDISSVNIANEKDIKISIVDEQLCVI